MQLPAELPCVQARGLVIQITAIAGLGTRRKSLRSALQPKSYWGSVTLDVKAEFQGQGGNISESFAAVSGQSWAAMCKF